MSTPTAVITTRAPDVRGLPGHLQRPGSRFVRWTLTAIAVGFLSLFIVWPVANVFRSAFGLEWADFKTTALPHKLADGWHKYTRTFHVPEPANTSTLTRVEKRQLAKDQTQAQKTRDSIVMTGTALLVVVPLNVVFGLTAAWAVSKFSFRGKTFLVSLIDLPFSVSPVVAGLIFVLLMGREGVLGDWATHLHWPWPWSAYWQGFSGHWFPFGFTEWKEGVIFTPLATTLASAFVTFPFVARALIPLMESQGTEAEQAAITLGASGRQTFTRVTLPAIKWGLLYGIILCTARAVGEFGAVSVVSGGTDANDTMPLRVSKIWESYNQQQAFAVASLLAGVSVVTLLVKVVIDRKQGPQKAGRQEGSNVSIEVKHITKTFGAFKALDDVSLRVNQGELVALLGPSGSGKTTLLRIIAGLEVPDESTIAGDGAVSFYDENVIGRHVSQRKVGFVFQHYALFKNMTVFENVAFGLRVKPWNQRPARSTIRDKVEHLLKLVQLEGLAKRYPQQLSGGQRQRVALARALAVEPKVLLLDEPFGALDAKVRRELRRWLRHLHDDVGITSVFVTHDQEEALEVADRIAVLNKGKVEQIGTPEDVYERPANAFVLQFLGTVNQFHGRQTGAAKTSYVRPHDVAIVTDAGNGAIPAEVEHVAFAGATVSVTLKRMDDGSMVEAQLPRQRHLELGLARGQRVFVAVKEAHTFDGDYVI